MERAYFDRFVIDMYLDDAYTGSHQGQCDDDVEYLVKRSDISTQLDKIDPLLIRAELKEYGAWNEKELDDQEQNRRRIVWIACGQIIEECVDSCGVCGPREHDSCT